MEKIIIGFSRPKGWFEPFSWLIRLVQWTPYSHAYIKYADPYTNRNIIYQASGLKVNFIGETMFDTKEIVCAEFIIPISDAMKQQVIQGAIDKCGSPYGVGQIIGFAWVLFGRFLGKKFKNPLYSTSSDFCSELTEEILIQIGDANMDPSTMDPKDIVDYLTSKGFTLEK